LEKISKNGAKFDPEKAKWFNHQQLLLKTNESIAEEIIEECKANEIDTDVNYLSKVVGLMKEKVNFKHEILAKAKFFFNVPAAYDEQVVAKKWTSAAVDFLADFAQRISVLTCPMATDLEQIFKDLAAEKNVGTGAVMQPLRLAISGEGGGPPLFEMLSLIGVQSCSERIGLAIQKLPLNQNS
jgi:glutamyl-tRNA synthetase